MNSGVCRQAKKTVLCAGLALFALPSVQAQALGVDFAASYTITDLGSVAGLPPLYGGLTFAGDNTLLIGGNANDEPGRIYSVGVTRDATTHRITGFSGSAELYRGAGSLIGEYNDGGVVFGPGGVLFTSRWPVNQLGQTKPGSIDEDKIIDMAALGVADSHAALNFVPAGFGGAGQVKFVSWSGGEWYSATLTPDGSGTYDIAGLVQVDVDASTGAMDVLPGGPEGFTYVAAANPGFGVDSMLLSEFSDGSVAAYALDANGNPVLTSRRDFVTGLVGAEGATLDPVTGDFLFSTFGGGDRLVLVSGFTEPPPPPIPEPSSAAMMVAGLAGLIALAGRRRRGPTAQWL